MWNNEVTNINYILGRYPCEITKLPIEPMFPTQLGVYLRKNSSLTKVFEYVFFVKGLNVLATNSNCRTSI